MKTKEKKQSKTKQKNDNKSNTPPPKRTTETTAKDFIYRVENFFSKAQTYLCGDNLQISFYHICL